MLPKAPLSEKPRNESKIVHTNCKIPLGIRRRSSTCTPLYGSRRGPEPLCSDPGAGGVRPTRVLAASSR
jgi:hypothetical protein